MAKLDERQLNLMFLLLNSSSPVPKHVIFERVPGYTEGSQESIDKSFDRDKKALRKQGIDIKMQSPDELFTVDYGYYIERDRVLLPEIKLSTRERELISMASYVWHDLQLSQAAHIAGRPIGNALVETDLDAPHIGPQEHLLALIEAVSASRIVQFDYRKPTAEESSSRRLEPWRIFCTGGAWYVIGWDVDNDRDSTFRLSRITGSVRSEEHTSELQSH